jgi:hypothetical protein
MEVTVDDINRLHERVDKLVDCNEKTVVDIAVIKTKLEGLVIPKQPCDALAEHLNNHKENRRVWQRPLVRTVVDLVKMAVVAGLTWLFVKDGK